MAVGARVREKVWSNCALFFETFGQPRAGMDERGHHDSVGAANKRKEKKLSGEKLPSVTAGYYCTVGCTKTRHNNNNNLRIPPAAHRVTSQNIFSSSPAKLPTTNY